MLTDNSIPDRYVLQPETRTEEVLLAAVMDAFRTRERAGVERAYWTMDVPEYPGLSELAWRDAGEMDPPRMALVVDFEEAPEE